MMSPRPALAIIIATLAALGLVAGFLLVGKGPLVPAETHDGGTAATDLPSASAASGSKGSPPEARLANVRDFGAGGQGSADDTDAIHRARDAAGAGGTVLFPSGTYRFSKPLEMSIRGQVWQLSAGATLRAGAQILMNAPAVRLVGPGSIDMQAGDRSGVNIKFQAASLDQGARVEGVEIHNGGRGGSLISVNGDYAQVVQSYLHDSAGLGVEINTDNNLGHRGIEIRGNRFLRIDGDAINSKGTNGDWRNGAWIPQEKRNVGHKFIDNRMEQTGRRSGFSLEIQDGHQGTEIRGNWADTTYSIVGQVGASVVGNTFVGKGRGWGMEIGNFRGGVVSQNSFTGCATGIAMTGDKDQRNADNVFSNNTFVKCDTRIKIDWDGGGNQFDTA